MTEICHASDIDPELAVRAATWLAGFHPEVAVTTDGPGVKLKCAGWSVAELEMLWVTALANERLFERASPFRAAVLQTLVE